MTTETIKKKGRPSKAQLAEVKARPVGRPKGVQGIIDEYRDRMLMSPKSAKVLESIFNAALDNEHKNQAAAWKLIVDRIAPISAFDPNNKANGQMPTISINITSLGQAPKVETLDDVTDIGE